MATEGTTRPDEPLRQFPEDKYAPSLVCKHQIQNADDYSQPTVAVDTYNVPGTAQPDPEAEQAVADYENEPRADTNVDERSARASLVADSRSPEANYLTRDNIVFPDPRPEEAARVERFAKETIGLGVDPESLKVEQDSVDLHEQLLREGRRDSETPVQEQAGEIRDEASSQREDVDAQTDNVVGPV